MEAARCGAGRLLLRELNPYIVCTLCGGYFIDATTIVECLHSFCRSCIVRHLEKSKFCPICDVQVHKAKPLQSLRSDRTLQTLVYKLVPGLYQAEVRRRREFEAGHGVPPRPQSPSYFLSADDAVLLELRYHQSDFPTDDGDPNGGEMQYTKEEAAAVRPWYLRCPAAVSIRQLKHLVRSKFGVTDEHRVDVIYRGECLPDTFTLMDIAYTFSCQRSSRMQVTYRIYRRQPTAATSCSSSAAGSETEVEAEEKPQGEGDAATAAAEACESAPADAATKATPEGAEGKGEGKREGEREGEREREGEGEGEGEREGDADGEGRQPPPADAEAGAGEEAQGAPTLPSAPALAPAPAALQPESTSPVDAPPPEPQLQLLPQHSAPAPVADVQPAVPDPAPSVESAGQQLQLEATEAKDCEAAAPPTDCQASATHKTEGQAESQSQPPCAEAAPELPQPQLQLPPPTPLLAPPPPPPPPPPLPPSQLPIQLSLAPTRLVLPTTSFDPESIADDFNEEEDEDEFTLRISSSEGEEEEAVPQPLPEKPKEPESVPEKPEEKEEQPVLPREKRCKSVGKLKVKDYGSGRKRSKHKSKHHARGDEGAKKRRVHKNEFASTPTILQYDKDNMKLKVKLNSPTSPVISNLPSTSNSGHHKHHHSKHHHHNKHQEQQDQNEAGAGSSGEMATANGSWGNAAKERPPQIRPLRANKTLCYTPKPPPEPAEKKNVLMPPSSITVSKVTAGEKRKLDHKANSASESKRPALEIMLVNAPGPSQAGSGGQNKTAAKPSAASKQANEKAEGQSGKPARPLPATIPLMRIKKPSPTGVRQLTGLTITPKPPASKADGGKAEEEQAIRHDDIGALDLSGKSSRARDGSSPASPELGSPPSTKSPTTAAAASQQSILSIAQTLVHRQLSSLHPGLVTANLISSTVPGRNGSNSPNAASDGALSSALMGALAGPGATPTTNMSNLKTLSEAAVQIRNMMQPAGKRAPGKQQQQKAGQGSPRPQYPGFSLAAAAAGAASPIRIPVPPSKPAGGARLPDVFPCRGRGQAGYASRKPGPNQAVRHIPNPSALMFRQQQQRLQAKAPPIYQGYATSKASAAAAAAATTTAAQPPVSNIRKMENMTRNIEKVAAGLTIRAVEANVTK